MVWEFGAFIFEAICEKQIQGKGDERGESAEYKYRSPTEQGGQIAADDAADG